MIRTLLGIALLAGVAGAAGAEEAPKTPKQELEELMHEGHGHAKSKLEGGIDFLAFAIVKPKEGKTRYVHAPVPKRVQPGVEETFYKPEQVFDNLVKKLREEEAASGGFRAVAIFSDDEIKLKGKKRNAVQAGLEHESGYCVNIFTPYGRLVQGELVWGKAVSSPRPEGLVLDGCK